MNDSEKPKKKIKLMNNEEIEKEKNESLLESTIPHADTEGKEFECETIVNSDVFEIIVLVGYPTSGKTTFAEKYFKPECYELLSFNNKEKTVKAAKELLEKGKSIVIDNTNETIGLRGAYIKLSKLYNTKIRCLRFLTSREQSEHLNYYRERVNLTKTIPNMVYNCFDRHFVEPNIDEGFDSIIPIKFILNLKDLDKQKYYIPKPVKSTILKKSKSNTKLKIKK